MFRRRHGGIIKWVAWFAVACIVIAQFTSDWSIILAVSAILSTLMIIPRGTKQTQRTQKTKKKRSFFGSDPVVENLTNRVLAQQHVSSSQQYYKDDDINVRMRRKYNAENEARYQQYQYEKRAYRYPNAYDTREAKNRAVRARTEANKW